MLESDFQRNVLQLAQQLGWLVAHFRPAQTKHGWRTPVAGDGKGFPDLVLVKDTVIFAEVKSEKGRLSPEQERWRDTLIASGAEYHLWRPQDIQAIADRLACRP